MDLVLQIEIEVFRANQVGKNSLLVGHNDTWPLDEHTKNLNRKSSFLLALIYICCIAYMSKCTTAYVLPILF